MTNINIIRHLGRTIDFKNFNKGACGVIFFVSGTAVGVNVLSHPCNNSWIERLLRKRIHVSYREGCQF